MGNLVGHITLSMMKENDQGVGVFLRGGNRMRDCAFPIPGLRYHPSIGDHRNCPKVRQAHYVIWA